MPTYEYRCKDCGENLEVVQAFTDEALTECPYCQGALKKVFNSVGISFKGSGFYKTDSRSSATTGSSGSGTSEGSPSSSDGAASSDSSGSSTSSKGSDSGSSTSSKGSDSGSSTSSKGSDSGSSSSSTKAGAASA
jgi:putative FmdB family regulatory protein